jgi:hypothetical protein
MGVGPGGPGVVYVSGMPPWQLQQGAVGGGGGLREAASPGGPLPGLEAFLSMGYVPYRDGGPYHDGGGIGAGMNMGVGGGMGGGGMGGRPSGDRFSASLPVHGLRFGAGEDGRSGLGHRDASQDWMAMSLGRGQSPMYPGGAGAGYGGGGGGGGGAHYSSGGGAGMHGAHLSPRTSPMPVGVMGGRNDGGMGPNLWAGGGGGSGGGGGGGGGGVQAFNGSWGRGSEPQSPQGAGGRGAAGRVDGDPETNGPGWGRDMSRGEAGQGAWGARDADADRGQGRWDGQGTGRGASSPHGPGAYGGGDAGDGMVEPGGDDETDGGRVEGAAGGQWGLQGRGSDGGGNDDGGGGVFNNDDEAQGAAAATLPAHRGRGWGGPGSPNATGGSGAGAGETQLRRQGSGGGLGSSLGLSGSLQRPSRFAPLLADARVTELLLAAARGFETRALLRTSKLQNLIRQVTGGMCCCQRQGRWGGGGGGGRGGRVDGTGRALFKPG